MPYFEPKTDNLPSFWGFVPRWYIPHVPFNFENFEYPVSLTLIVVDQIKENYVYVGFDWPPIRLEQNELMV